MTKTVYKRRHLIGGWLTISEGESMTVTEGSVTGRQAPEQ